MEGYYIAHHGILGQKWGKKQGPPYPLDGSDHSSAEKKAAKSAGISVGKSSSKVERRQNHIQKRIDKENSSWDKYETRLMTTRNKSRGRIESKYDKKIEKAKNDEHKSKLESKKDFKIKDFDDGTKMISKAISIGRENSTKYLEMKKDVLVNKDLKNSFEYKEAKRWFSNQKMQESGILTNTPGKAGAMLQELSAMSRGKSSTRSNTDLREKHINAIKTRAEREGGHIDSNGRYVASNGVVVSKSRGAGVAAMRKAANSSIGYTIAKAGMGTMAKNTGRTKESIRNQSDRERAALKEYWSVGGDTMLKKYNYYKN